MMNLKIELRLVVIVLEFFVLMILMKLLKHMIKTHLLIISVICLFMEVKNSPYWGSAFSEK